MPAALLMALLQGSLRTLITAGLRGADLVAKLNAHLCANIPSNRLVTLFYGELDPATGALRYVNAGHNPPFLLRADGAERAAGTDRDGPRHPARRRPSSCSAPSSTPATGWCSTPTA